MEDQRNWIRLLMSEPCVYIFKHDNTINGLALFVHQHPDSLCERSAHHQEQHPSGQDYRDKPDEEV